jgi:hypothetical protein
MDMVVVDNFPIRQFAFTSAQRFAFQSSSHNAIIQRLD